MCVYIYVSIYVLCKMYMSLIIMYIYIHIHTVNADRDVYNIFSSYIVSVVFRYMSENMDVVFSSSILKIIIALQYHPGNNKIEEDK